MPFLLKYSFDTLPIAAVATPLWMAFLVLAVTGFAAFRRNDTDRASKHRPVRWFAEIAILIAIPVGMLEVGHYIGMHNRFSDSSLASYQSIALNIVGVLGIVEVAT